MKISINRYFALSFVTVILAVVLLSCGTPPSSNRTTSTRSSQEQIRMRQNTYMAILREEGCTTRIDEDGDIEFVWQDNTYYIIMDQDDPSFVNLLLYLGYIDTYEAQQQISIAIGNANRNTKVAKAYIIGTNTGRDPVYIVAQSFLEDPNSFRAVISRMMSSVNMVAQRIIDEVS